MKKNIPLLLSTLFVCITLHANKPLAVQDTLAPQYTIYLTFDDGPLSCSHHIDTLISKYKIKCNMFLIGQHIDEPCFKNNYKRYVDNPYIDVYNHSYCHANERYWQFYKQPQGVVDDIVKNQNKHDILHKIVRLPGRNSWYTGKRILYDTLNGKEALNMLANNGYRVFGWDIEWKHDGKGNFYQTPQQLTDSIKHALKAGTVFTANHLVLLVHDQMFVSKYQRKLLEDFILNILESPNYTFQYLRFYPQ
ncbi:MAG: polysaccharide deacetylase family protein [Marinifilaceae bacterium]